MRPDPPTGPEEYDADLTRALVVCAVRQHGLTPAETDVAIRLARGESIALISQSRDVSKNTVRTQVHHIYEIARVSNREEFQADVLDRVVSILASLGRSERRR